ncbi:hypothetical protein FO519_001708 [Halicephalobus sp. NKZ332]|nr:hypothetical protein FO519_001708 [Halicephalobus sp. NKZ332]
MIRAILCRARVGAFVARRLVTDRSVVDKLEFHGSGTSSALKASEKGNEEITETERGDHYLDEQETDKDASRLIEALRKLDDAAPILGSGLVKDPAKRLSIEEMESPDDTTSRNIQWRKIIYDEGELDKSDLSQPPSKLNPHPFDPTDPEMAKALPLTHARSMAAFVNHSKVLQNLLDLGVDLLDIDTKTKLARHLVRLDWEKDVFPKLAWLVKGIGVDRETLGKYLTRNPFFLVQNLDDMKTRVAYLQSKKFTSKEIAKIVTEHRYWLNIDVKTTDARLGWLQRQFKLTGDQVRTLIVKEPRVLYFGLGPLQRVVLLFNKELAFPPAAVKKMIMTDPRLFMMDYEHIVASYNYFVLVMNIPNSRLIEYPTALRCSVSVIRKRHEFLKKVNKAVYDPELPGYVSLEQLLQPSDKKFAEKVARIKAESYDRFLKTL